MGRALDWGWRLQSHRMRRYRWAAALKVERLEDRRAPAFLTGLSYDVGNHPQSVAVADFNGDGIQDLTVANTGTGPTYADSSVSVLLGNGDGTFQPAQNFTTGKGPQAVAVGDFNGDGILDLATANLPGNNVSVLLGNGDGTFQPAATSPCGAVLLHWPLEISTAMVTRTS